MAVESRNETFYITGGTLPPDASSYVERQADRDLLSYLLAGDYCYVLNSRQMGKSSLSVRAIGRLREAGVRTAFCDLTRFGGKNLTADQWYAALLSEIGRELKLRAEFLAYWKEHADLPPVQRLFGAIADVGLSAAESPVVIFIDEIDVTLSLPFSADEFFAAIRQCCVGRATEERLKRLTFCLLGTATPSDLIQNTRVSPFNIGRRIELRDFTPEEAAGLAAGLVSHKDTKAQRAEGNVSRQDATSQREEEGSRGDGETRREEEPTDTRKSAIENRQLLDRVLYWTGGHPYLTQRLCRAIAEAPVTNHQPPATFVDRLCSGLFLTHTARESDDNLAFVRNRLLRSEADLAALLDLYRKMRSGVRVPDDETNPLTSILKLSGVARVEDGLLKVRNRIYAHVFDRQWVETHMPDAEVRRQRAAYRKGLLRATGFYGLILAAMIILAVSAFNSARIARQAGTLARANADEAVRNLYFANMNVIQADYEHNNFGRMNKLLDETRNSPERGFEWDYWNRLCHQDMMTLRGHSMAIWGVSWSSDGTRIVTGSEDKTAKIWDANTGQLIRTLIHSSAVFGARFTKDYVRVVTTDEDNTATVWNSRTGQKLAELRTFPKAVSCAISPDGSLYAASDNENTIKVFIVDSGRKWLALKGHRGPLTSIAISPDRERILTGSADKTVRVWNIHSGKPIMKLEEYTDAVSASYSPDGSKIVTASSDGTANICNASNGAEIMRLTGRGVATGSAVYSPDGQQVLLSKDDNTARLCNATTGHEQLRFRGHAAGIWAIDFSPDGNRIVTASVDGTAKIWSLKAQQETLTLNDHKGWILSVAYSPDGSRILTGSNDNTAKIWNGTDGHEIMTLHGPIQAHAFYGMNSYNGLKAEFSPDGSRIVTASADKTARVWDVGTGRVILALRGHKDAVISAAFSPDGRRIVTGSTDMTAKVWDAVTGAEHRTLIGHTELVESAMFSPDGKRIFTGSWDSSVRIWDAESGLLLKVLHGHASAIRCLGFSSDGSRLITGSTDTTAKIWDARTFREIQTLVGHASEVAGVAYSPDDQRIVTCSNDGTAKVWDAATGREILTIRGHTGRVFCVAFSPDGTHIVTGSDDTTVRVWTSIEVNASAH